ncbi:MAG: hypothetical protein A2X94_02290 [Bdellovibrionales bacterium GWB1_55_8]|nr:MAG: hypothetical protein A2X94_02290 [Bdellovibrionales bacterium GWB1_55_8]
MLPSPDSHNLSADQERALQILDGEENVFLTGAAGSGKSYLLREFLKNRNPEKFPVLASTGAAAILVGGRTFHSFFGLGIMEGGREATLQRALSNKRLLKRLQKVDGVVIDEVSMLSGPTLALAEEIAREARDDLRPWGGLRVIAVGDFAQLPPVNVFGGKEWAFLDSVWHRSGFVPAILNEVMRTSEHRFLAVLNAVRNGEVDESVADFLTERSVPPPSADDVTRLFARREDVERYNLARLAELRGDTETFITVYSGKEREVERFQRQAPVPDTLSLKNGALVMMRLNDPEQRWVNGSLGRVHEMSSEKLWIRLLNGKDVEIERVDFTLLDADGKPVATANNFPVILAWALTIHKAQGATLDRMCVDLRRLWEPGQAYVALSRVRSEQGLYIEGWHPRSIFSDPVVTQFYRMIQE